VSRPLVVSDSIVVAADPLELYAEVSDPTRMSRWSPENTGATTPGAGSLTVGQRFSGTNTRGLASWVTSCVVTDAVLGERFGFEVDRIGFGLPVVPARIAHWEYTFEAVAEGTLVTETWTDRRRWPDLLASRFDPLATGGRMFHEFQARNIARTLAQLKADFESR